MSTEIKLDLLASFLGFLGSVVLLITAIRSSPLQALLDKVGEASTSDPSYAIAMAIKAYAQTNLARIRLWDPRLMYLGIALLIGGYGLSLLKDILIACGHAQS
jgi:hypothetical protein